MPSSKKNYADQEKFRVYRNKQRQKNYAKTAKYPRKKWTDEEGKMVLAHNITDVELSAKLERSVQSIQNKRYKLKK